jgi:DTW domain-containing protein YfiP
MPRHAHVTTRCSRCQLHLHRCICDQLPVVESPVEVVVVQHWKESLKPTSTGSLLSKVVDRGSVRFHGHRDHPFDDTGLDDEHTWLVFPDRTGDSSLPVEPPRKLVLIDGNWNQASRMARRIPALARLPRLALLAPARPVLRLRLPPDPTACSTMEAAAAALRLCGHESVAVRLEWMHDFFVAATLRQRGLTVPDPA